MKHTLSMIFAGLIGGMIAIYVTSVNEPQTVAQIAEEPSFVRTTNESPSTIVAGFDFVDAAEKVTPAVVHIEASQSKALTQQQTEERNRGRNSPFDFFDFDIEDFFGPQFYGPKNGTGSGVIISSDGYIVTNDHVVGFADEIKVSLSDKREFIAEKVGTDPSTDLALLKINATDLEFVKIANSDDVKVEQWVADIGNPFSYLKSTVTAGIVSAKGRDIDIIKGEKTIEEFIQTDAAINPGNSGGALVNHKGNLIGINTAIATPTGVFAGYSFAIPSNLVMRIVDDIKENGDIRRARLGVAGDTVDDELVSELNLKVVKGFYIAELEPGSAAQLSGLLPGDVIIGANGQRIDNFDDLSRVMEFAKVGDVVSIKVQRKKKQLDFDLKLRKGL